MDKTILDYYQENLQYMRDQGRDFAKEFPKIASRLGLTENQCEDPYVERLLEGAAFLSAKVERELDSCMPLMLESVLGSVHPEALELIPSYAVAELKDFDSNGLSAHPFMPAESLFSVIPEGLKTPCIFSTLISAAAFPVSLLESRYLTLDLQKFGLNAESGLYLKFRKEVEMQIDASHDELLLYLNMSGAAASELLQHLQTECSGTSVIINGEKFSGGEINFTIPLSDDSPESGSREFYGWKLFYLFLFFQSGFHFLRIHGLAQYFNKLKNNECMEVIITFRKRRPEFLQYIDSSSLRMNCVPLVNLFRKKTDRMPVGQRNLHHLVPDRAEPLSYEISNVLSVSVYDNSSKKLLDLRRLYDIDYSDSEDSFNFYSIHRYPRVHGDTERRRSSYAGQEIYLSFSGEQYREIQQNAAQFSAEVLCTNRDLPLFLRDGDTLAPQVPGAFRSAVLLDSPTAPENPVLSGSGADYAEQAASLMLHFTDLIWSDGVFPKDLMKKIIHKNLPLHNSENLSGLERSIYALENTKETFRYVLNGQVFYESGWKIRLVLDETACVGIGSYIFGTLARELLRSSKPVNVPAKIILETRQQGKMCEWMI